MKKIIFFLSPFLLVFCFSFSVHAEFMPPTLPDFSSVNLPVFLEQGAQMTMVSQNGALVPQGSFDKLNQIINGRSVQDSLNYRYVDNSIITSDLQLFYNTNGDIVPQSQSYTVFGSSDIGDFACVCDKTTGEILYSYDEYENMISTLVMGGFYYDTLVPNPNRNNQQEFNKQIQKAMDENLIVYGDHVSEEDISNLSRYDFYLTYQSNASGYTVFVPNACTVNTVCEVLDCPYYEYKGSVTGADGESARGWRPIIRTNDPSEVIYSTEGRDNYLRAEINRQFGYTFNYISQINVGSIPLFYGGYIAFHLPTQQEYNEFRSLSNDVVYVQPAANSGETNEYYDYTYVTNNYTRPSPIINRNYDNSTTTNTYNYPVTNNVTYPDYSSNTNNYFDTIYNYFTTPSTGDSLGQINENDLTNNIPILSNLRYRFPFSIPFDLYDMGKALAVDREVPVIDFSFFIPVINYDAHIQFDLTPWNDLFVLFRKLELIIFVVALAVFSYDHYFGT